MNRTETKTTGNSLSRQWLMPERFMDEINRGRREEHTQKKFVPIAMNYSLVTKNRWKSPAARPQHMAGALSQERSPSTLMLNRSNVKHKPAARGRTR